MARPLRIQAEGLTYHITARGTGRMDIYRDAIDRRRFLALLAGIADEHGLECHAFCLMSNHYHLVLTTASANVSTAMRLLNSLYAQRWNKRHGRVGHLFQGRFGAQVVQDGQYFVTVCRYVDLNPVRAGLVSAPERWPWSSFRATVGLTAPPPFLRREVLMAQFGGSDHEAARRYWQFVVAHPADEVTLPPHRLLGDEAFVRQFGQRAMAASDEVPRWERLAGHPLTALFAGAVTRSARAEATVRAHRLGYALVDIARFLGLHYTTVGKVVAGARAGSERENTDEERCDPRCGCGCGVRARKK